MRIFPYNDANVKPRLLSRIYSKDGPVIIIMPRITTGIEEKRGIIIEITDIFINSSSDVDFLIAGTTTRARYMTPPIHIEAAKLCIRSIVIGRYFPLAAPWPTKLVVKSVTRPITSMEVIPSFEIAILSSSFFSFLYSNKEMKRRTKDNT
ncbi:MAG: hypothetical protein WBM37_05450, partial [Nitrososphaeraceae archaeon]